MVERGKKTNLNVNRGDAQYKIWFSCIKEKKTEDRKSVFRSLCALKKNIRFSFSTPRKTQRVPIFVKTYSLQPETSHLLTGFHPKCLKMDFLSNKLCPNQPFKIPSHV